MVLAESTLKDYKRQLKQLLQITDQDEFDVVVPTTTDEMALQTIPTVPTVYDAALSYRPEIQNAQLGIKSSDLSIKIAKAQRMPTIGLSASASTSTTTMSSNAWSKQMKNNFVTGAGVTLSIPILDQRETKTAVNKAILQRQNYELDLRDKQTTLYSTIENYWLQAYNNQAQFKSAKVSTESAQASYDLLQEQFKQNLKNVIEADERQGCPLESQASRTTSKILSHI